MRYWVHYLLVMALTVLFTESIVAQYTVQHQPPTAIVRGEVTPLEFIVPGVTLGDVQEANLFYRFDDGVSYQQQEVLFQNGSFVTTLEVNDISNSVVEYYFQLTLVSGQDFFYPQTSPSENPVRLDVIEPKEEGRPVEELERSSLIDYTIISPEQGEPMGPNDAVIAISLYYDVNQLEPGEFRLFLDNRDVTEQADTSAYFISYAPKSLRNGAHTIRVEYVTQTNRYLVEKWSFVIVDPSDVSYASFGGSNARPIGNVELGARNQVIGGNPNNAYTARTNVSGTYGLLRYSINGFFTSQESARLQPQNRFGMNLQLGKWLGLQAGHVFPNMGRFTINGRRVYGINTEAHLLNENLNVQFIYGELSRKVTNLYSSVLVEEEEFNGTVVDTSYTLQYENQGRGTFQREILGGRIGIGNERKFQIGVQAMKVQDDTTSIFNVRNFNDLSPELTSGLSPADINKLSDDPDLLQVQNGSVQPKGNFVAGLDMKMGFNNNRIRLEAEGVVSALNNDIYGGYLTVQQADELGFEIDQETEDILSRLSQFIIVNENMNVLPLRIKDIDTDSATADPYFPTSILAGNGEFSINYPSNNFKLQYRWIGPDFNSLANSTVRKDIAGFTASDRFRMFKNRLYVTLGYEVLEDNVSNTKDATTQSKTYRTNLSWYPIKRELPRVSLGMRYRSRDNSVARFNPYVSPDLEKAAVQNFMISGTDTLGSAVPKNNTTLNVTGSLTQQFELLDIRHDASLSFSSLKTTDEVFAFGDVSSSAISLNLTSRFNELSLRTQFGMTINNTQTGSGQTDINIFGMYLGGSYFMMDNKLNLNGRLAVTSNRSTVLPLIVDPASQADGLSETDYFILDTANPVKSDFSTFVLQAGAQYDVNEYHSLIFDANLTNVSGGNSNDRIVQLRYLFNF